MYAIRIELITQDVVKRVTKSKFQYFVFVKVLELVHSVKFESFVTPEFDYRERR